MWDLWQFHELFKKILVFPASETFKFLINARVYYRTWNIRWSSVAKIHRPEVKLKRQTSHVFRTKESQQNSQNLKEGVWMYSMWQKAVLFFRVNSVITRIFFPFSGVPEGAVLCFPFLELFPENGKYLNLKIFLHSWKIFLNFYHFFVFIDLKWWFYHLE